MLASVSNIMIMMCVWPKCKQEAFFELEVTDCKDEDGDRAIDVVLCTKHYEKALSYKC